MKREARKDRKPASPFIGLIHNRSTTTSIARSLATAGMRSEVYHTASEFFTDNTIYRPDCIIVDAALMNEGKYSLLDGTTKLSPVDEDRLEVVPVIVLATQDFTKARRMAEEFGAAAFFREPLDDEALLDAILWKLHPTD